MVVDFPDFLMLTLCRVYNAVVMKFVIILFRQCGDFIFLNIYFGYAFVSVGIMVLLFPVSLLLTFCRVYSAELMKFVVCFVSAEMLLLLLLSAVLLSVRR